MDFVTWTGVELVVFWTGPLLVVGLCLLLLIGCVYVVVRPTRRFLADAFERVFVRQRFVVLYISVAVIWLFAVVVGAVWREEGNIFPDHSSLFLLEVAPDPSTRRRLECSETDIPLGPRTWQLLLCSVFDHLHVFLQNW